MTAGRVGRHTISPVRPTGTGLSCSSTIRTSNESVTLPEAPARYSPGGVMVSRAASVIP